MSSSLSLSFSPLASFPSYVYDNFIVILLWPCTCNVVHSTLGANVRERGENCNIADDEKKGEVEGKKSIKSRLTMF